MLKTGKLILPIVLVTLLAALIAGCSTANQDSPLSFFDSSGNHPDGWISAHGQYAAPDGSLCMGCHGDDLAGGITGVSCSSDAVGCHSGGPAFHPVDWVNNSATGNTWHADAKQNGLLIGGLACFDCHNPLGSHYLNDPGKCTVCHFTDGGDKAPGGWTHPPPYDDNHSDFADSPAVKIICVKCHEVNNSFGNEPSGHGCESCHDAPYLAHNLAVPTSNDFTAQCSTCHSISGTSPEASAPVCISCHKAGNPYSRTNCTSCHGRPPNTGEHGEHQSEGVSCDECHQDAGSGNGLNHFYDNDVDVKFSDSGITYNSGGRCSGNCHSEKHTNENWW